MLTFTLVLHGFSRAGTIGEPTKFKRADAPPAHATTHPATQISCDSINAVAFPVIPDQKRGTKLLVLNAVSSAGVPVYYYVREGPAKVDGDVLKFTPIPPRAKFPVRVTVVAWQYGRTVEPKLQSAERVARTFYIEK